MTQTHQKFTIHPVGQGFFYSGAIEFSRLDDVASLFNFVFDCGSMNKANCADEIATYQKHHFPDDTSLDLLVISHFDQDHVNHIYKLLDGKRKVKKIVAPFLNFSERFLLFLRWISFPGPLATGPEELFFISLILDPVAALTPLLDDKDGGIIFITSDPDNHPFTTGNPESNLPREPKGRIFHLDFGDISDNATGLRVKEVRDSERTTLSFGSIPVMEFLFYKKEIGKGEEEFYRKVHELFIAKYATFFKDPEKPLPEEITEVIKTIRTATVIEDLFKEAKKILKFEAYKYTKISDLNTSALCMLHRNMAYLAPRHHPDNWDYISDDIEVKRIQKFEQLPPLFSRTVTPFGHWHRNRWFQPKNFPNALLTSDSFLLTKTDVDAFYKRYKNYWNQYWIFQVPHHGSDNNTDVTLLSSIPHATEIFINYGIVKAWGGTWRHPSAQVITDIVATGHSLHFSPVNESAGIEFCYTLYR